MDKKARRRADVTPPRRNGGGSPGNSSFRGTVLILTDEPRRRLAVVEALLARGVSPQLAATTMDITAVMGERPPELLLVDIAGNETLPASLVAAARDVPQVLLVDDEPGPVLDGMAVVPGNLAPEQVAAIALDMMAERAPSDVRSYGGLTVNEGTHQVSLNGMPLEMSPNQFTVLAVLVRANGKVVETPALALALYASPDQVLNTAIRATVYRLRGRLQRAGLPDFVETVTSVGYRLAVMGSHP